MAIKGDFFAEKREWSKLKDHILAHYLTPYLAKIATTGRPTCIVDCFAGKGRFGDGLPGSPLIIMERVTAAVAAKATVRIKAIFIEQKHAVELTTNPGTAQHCEVIPGEYEDCISRLLARPVERDRNFFFYIDPYGIKNLNFAHFVAIKKAGFRSTELLINLNTTGFLREGCRLLKLARAVPDWADDTDDLSVDNNTLDRMDAIANGDYWQTILAQFQDGSIDFHGAEKQFVLGYARCLEAHFKHTVNIPIRERSNHLPKYRLIFSTDHPDGLFLMADEMHKAWKRGLENESGGQLYLFDTSEMTHSARRHITDKILDELSEETLLEDLLVRLIRTHGICHTTGEYKKAIKTEEGAVFTVTRTALAGKGPITSRSMSHHDFRIMVAPT